MTIPSTRSFRPSGQPAGRRRNSGWPCVRENAPGTSAAFASSGRTWADRRHLRMFEVAAEYVMGLVLKLLRPLRCWHHTTSSSLALVGPHRQPVHPSGVEQSRDQDGGSTVASGRTKLSQPPNKATSQPAVSSSIRL